MDLPEQDGNVISLTWRPDGGLLAAGTERGTVLLIDVVKGQLVGTLTAHRGHVRGIAFSPDGSLVATGTAEDQVVLWDVPGRRLVGLPLDATVGGLECASWNRVAWLRGKARRRRRAAPLRAVHHSS